jgi:hemerythrin
MAYWDWDTAMEIGISSIDQQHRQIVDYINTLSEAVARKDRRQVGDVLDELVKYTINHFSFEEFLMQHGEYPAFENHRKVHEMFRDRVLNYQSRLDRGDDIARELLRDLKVWLSDHIQRDDRDYAPYVKKKVEAGWVSRVIRKFFG